MTLAAGSKAGPYEIVAPLDAGGMGAVYRAHDSRLDHDVAVKVAEIMPLQVAGLRISRIFITPDGRFWAHSHSQLLTDLYGANGVR